MQQKYAADAIRLFVLSDSPPEKDLEWSASGIEGCARFINKLEQMQEAVITLSGNDNTNKELKRLIHFTIKHVVEDIKHFALNRAIARMRELFNAISNEINKEAVDVQDAKHGFNVLIQLLNPFIPHITEEIWQKLGHKTFLYNSTFPIFDESMLELDTYVIAVQVNGKLRDTYEFNTSASEDEIKQIAINLTKVQKFLEGKEPKKIILVPKKIINIIG